jgi:hypothetical protein
MKNRIKNTIALLLALLAPLSLACTPSQQAKAPSIDQLAAVVTGAVASVDSLVAKANAVADDAKAVASEPDKFKAGLRLAKTIAESAVLVSDVGLAACAELPQVKPYTDVCDKLATAKVKATDVLTALSVLGGE